jgi:AcrR family transcriptional regulator
LTLPLFSTILSKKERKQMPKIVDARAQRQEIRRAARRVFARRGVRGTGLAHVAGAAGMGRSSLYHYYPDKASLVRDLSRELLDEEEALFAAAVRAEGSPLERLDRLAGSLVHFFDAWSSLGRVVADLRSLDRGRFRTFFRTIRGHLADLIAEGQAQGEIDPGLDPTHASATLIGAIDGLLLQDFVDPGAFRDRDALSRDLVTMLRKSLLP